MVGRHVTQLLDREMSTEPSKPPRMRQTGASLLEGKLACTRLGQITAGVAIGYSKKLEQRSMEKGT